MTWDWEAPFPWLIATPPHQPFFWDLSVINLLILLPSCRCSDTLPSIKGFPGGSAVKNPPAMQEMQVQSMDWEDPLEKEMATYSSVLAWESPRTEEPAGLQFMVSQRVGHDLGTKQLQPKGPRGFHFQSGIFGYWQSATCRPWVSCLYLCIQWVIICIFSCFYFGGLKLFFKLIFYWSVVDLQWCVNFRCIAKWFSCT